MGRIEHHGTFGLAHDRKATHVGDEIVVSEARPAFAHQEIIGRNAGRHRAPDGWIVDADRRIAGWRDLWKTGRGHVLIVTSNGAARFALLSDERLRGQASAHPSLKLRTGAYGSIARERGQLLLIAWDRRP